MSNWKLYGFFGLLLAALFLAVGQSQAGGWAVLTLDEWPASVTAGQPFTIGFMVRQHGRTPVSDLQATVTAVQPDSGQRVRVKAGDDGPVGHYAAEITLPAAGRWEWRIVDAFSAHPLPPLTVVAPTAAPPSASPDWFPTAVATGLVGLVGALALGWRGRPRWAVGLALLSVLLAGAGWLARSPATGTAVAQTETAVVEPADLGATLFAAKGCVSCHRHAATADYAGTNIGPDLTDYEPDPAFVRTWLADPTAVRPTTIMPDLALDETEIDALIAFLAGAD